jgi:signal transduction histidine kinase
LDVPDGGIQVDGDPDRLSQILGNLLVNAIKFTQQGGQVNVSVHKADNGCAEVVVSDTGRGVSAENLPKLFEPFFLADDSSTRREKGLGLGLAIVRLLTEAHGGSVTAVSSGPGKGAKFTVRLPSPTTRDRGADRLPSPKDEAEP